MPGKPDESALVERIFADDADELMPPPKSQQEADRRPEGDCSSSWIADGAEYQPHWSFIAAEAAAAAGGQERRLGAQPDRPLRPGRAGEARPAARPRGRPPHARPPAEPRPDRPAAGARPRSRRSSTTPRPTPTSSSSTSCWRRRTGASIAAATGSTPPATPTRTASTSTTSARSGPTATGSSTPSTATCRSTSSPSSSWPATCCPTATLDQQIAIGLQPLQHHHQRGRRHRRGVPRPLHARPHRDDVARSGWA